MSERIVSTMIEPSKSCLARTCLYRLGPRIPMAAPDVSHRRRSIAALSERLQRRTSDGARIADRNHTRTVQLVAASRCR